MDKKADAVNLMTGIFWWSMCSKNVCVKINLWSYLNTGIFGVQQYLWLKWATILQSQARRRMKSVLCYAKPSPIARSTAFPPFLSVNCQGWVVMRLRCLPLSRNSLTVASTSIFRRSSSTCLMMTVSHLFLRQLCLLRSPPVRVGARQHHFSLAVREEAVYR